MNKWFESGNLANYAKTALLQAQKRIDQVLDIKEEDIIKSTAAQTTQQQSIESNALSTATSTASALNTLFSASLSKLGGGGGGGEPPESTNENLGKQLLSSSSSSSLTTAIKKTPSSANVHEETDSFFSTFLSSSGATTVTNTNKTSTTTSTSSSSSSSKVETSTIVKVSNDDVTDSNTASITSSTATIDDKLSAGSSATPTTVSASSRNKLASKLELEKQNWIQSFVDKSLMKEDENEDRPNNVDSLVTVSTVTNESFQSAAASPHSSSESVEMIRIGQPEAADKTASSMTSDMEYVKIEHGGDKSAINVATTGVATGTTTKNSGGDGSEYNISGNASSNDDDGGGGGLETCASSDIEVLSLPSTTGGGGGGGGDLLQKSSTMGSMARVPSLASMAASSVGNGVTVAKKLKDTTKTGVSKLKPNSNVKQIFVKSPPPPPSPVTLTSSSSSLLQQQQADQQTNTKSSSDLLEENDISNMKNLLDVRETHVLKLNKQNVKLQEENDNLLNEIEKVKYEFNEKFAQQKYTLTQLKSKYDQVSSDKDTLKQLNFELEKELSDLKKTMSEKDSQVEQLTQEGLKLSKQELNHSNIIKKLRTKEKETEEVLNSLRNDYQKSQKEVEELKASLNAKYEAEERSMETFKKMEKTSVTLEKELINTKSLLEDTEEKVKNLENLLAANYKELSELRRENVEKDSKINEATSSIESHLKEEVRTAVEKEKMLWSKKQETMGWEIESLKMEMSRCEELYSIREDMLKKEISDLQQQLRDAETRNNELSQNISSATKPLLRQIENLQKVHSSQVELLENSERNLIQRLKESQTSLCEVSEKNRQNQDLILDLTQQCKLNEAQLQTLKAEKSKLNAEYQLMKTTFENLSNDKQEKEAQNNALISSLNTQIESLTREKKYLESQLEIEKTKSENDAKKLQSLMNEFNREKEHFLQQLKQQQQQQQPQQTQQEQRIQSPIKSPTNNFASFFEAKNELARLQPFELPHNMTGLNTLETLQSKLKQKEGEVLHLQKDVENLEKIRESMAREMVNLSDKVESYKQLEELKDKYDNNALLTMLGEKTEENEELRMDLQDVKEMYKNQIEELIKNQAS